MPSGSCLCRELRYEYPSEGTKNVLCHCRECKKMTGSACSTNVAVQATEFKLTEGTPKYYIFTRGEEKHTITFCSTCGTSIAKEVDGFELLKGLVTVQAGTLDDEAEFEQMTIDIEGNTKFRVAWMKQVDGALQL